MIWYGDIQDTRLIAYNRDVQSKPTWDGCQLIPDTNDVTSQSRNVWIIKQMKGEKVAYAYKKRIWKEDKTAGKGSGNSAHQTHAQSAKIEV